MLRSVGHLPHARYLLVERQSRLRGGIDSGRICRQTAPIGAGFRQRHSEARQRDEGRPTEAVPLSCQAD